MILENIITKQEKEDRNSLIWPSEGQKLRARLRVVDRSFGPALEGRPSNITLPLGAGLRETDPTEPHRSERTRSERQSKIE